MVRKAIVSTVRKFKRIEYVRFGRVLVAPISENVMQNLIAEFELTMALAGCKSVKEINADMLARKNG